MKYTITESNTYPLSMSPHTDVTALSEISARRSLYDCELVAFSGEHTYID